MSAKKNTKKRPIYNTQPSTEQAPTEVSAFVTEITPETTQQQKETVANNNQINCSEVDYQQTIQSCCQFMAANHHILSLKAQEVAEALWTHNQKSFNEFLTCQTYDQWRNFNTNYWQGVGEIMHESITQIQSHCNENLQELFAKQ